MARKPFLLRLEPATHEALQRWADTEMRSLNAQIEFLLRRALIESGRLRPVEEARVVEPPVSRQSAPEEVPGENES